MDGSELKVTVNRAPQKPKEGANVLGNDQKTPQSFVDAEAIKEQRRKIHKKFDQLEGAPVDDEAKKPVIPREDLDSIELQLPNGMIIEFGPPVGVSLSMRLIRILGEETENRVSVGIFRVLLCIRSIDENPVPTITTRIEAEKLANRIGDNGLDILTQAFRRYWSLPTLDDLPLIKKNQR